MIKLGNCLELIKKIPKNSVDTIVCDPPYHQGFTHNGQRQDFTDLNISEPFFEILFKEFKRVLKKDYAVYFFTDWRGYAFYYPIFNRILKAHNLLVWDKVSGPGNRYSYSHELVIFGSNKSIGGSSIIKDIKAFTIGAKKTNGEKIHPTQKPIELIENFILDSTDEGDTVMDCFMGSGTTGVACKKTGRKFIGFEIQKKYYELAKERINTWKE